MAFLGAFRGDRNRLLGALPMRDEGIPDDERSKISGGAAVAADPATHPHK